ESRGCVVVYATDHEQFSRFVRDPSPSARPQQAARLTDELRAQSEAQQKAFIDFVQGADLLIHDSQYTEGEYGDHMGWGHSTVEDAVRVATAGNVARLALYHHDPTHTDETIDAMQAEARRLAQQLRPSLDVFAASESLTIDLPSPAPAP
ncbi:MAG: MBL fold metallo-hydrolase, partial [Candidatus Xenobia bacterium]